ncbi:LysR substrate-binding domain-containing protein [Aureimonas ureilytica]|uniref:LysR substrate-binding domain-containing protein n=1 Tax=Aureimonas ureilytica TaxID=401562 RepID=UPI003CF31A62
MRVCAAPAYLDAAGRPGTPAELERHRAILYGRAGRVLSWQFPQEAGPALTLTPPSRLRFGDLGAIRDAAVAGHGLAWLPCWLIRDDVAAGRLVLVLDEEPSTVFDCHALWPQTVPLAPRVRLALDTLAAELPDATSLRTLCPPVGKAQT